MLFVSFYYLPIVQKLNIYTIILGVSTCILLQT